LRSRVVDWSPVPGSAGAVVRAYFGNCDVAAATNPGSSQSPEVCKVRRNPINKTSAHSLQPADGCAAPATRRKVASGKIRSSSSVIPVGTVVSRSPLRMSVGTPVTTAPFGTAGVKRSGAGHCTQ
jgi:hypothetical protein